MCSKIPVLTGSLMFDVFILECLPMISRPKVTMATLSVAAIRSTNIRENEVIQVWDFR